jgi:N-methylhydantoinase A
MPAHSEGRVSLLRGVFEQAVPSPAVEARHLLADAARVWAGYPAQGVGPQAIFAATTTVWVPAGWGWSRQSDGALVLHRIADNEAGHD